MKKFLIGLFSLSCFLVTCHAAMAEEYIEASDAEVAAYFDQLRAEFRSNKAALVGSQMNVAEKDAEAFWRIYAEYERELTAFNDKRLEAMSDYLDNYDKMNSQKAGLILDRHFNNQSTRVALRKKYSDKIARIISPLVALRFVHVDTQIALIIESELLARLPFAEIN